MVALAVMACAWKREDPAVAGWNKANQYAILGVRGARSGFFGKECTFCSTQGSELLGVWTWFVDVSRLGHPQAYQVIYIYIHT